MDALLTGAGAGTAIAALLGLFKLIGGGVGWLVDRKDKQSDKVTHRLDLLEASHATLNSKLLIVGGALAEAIAELRHSVPASPGLERYERALRMAFPIEENPAGLAELAARVDRLNAGSKK